MACYSIHHCTFSIKFDCICGVNGDNLLILPSKNYTDLPYILFAYSVGQHAILLYIFTLLVPCCDVRYRAVRLVFTHQLFVGGGGSCLNLCLYPYRGVKQSGLYSYNHPRFLVESV